MKSYHFILGYFLVGLFIGVLQTIICIITGFIISLISNVGFISIGKILLLIIDKTATVMYNITVVKIRWCGEIGRRKGLKIPRWQHRTGSSPVTGTKAFKPEPFTNR